MRVTITIDDFAQVDIRVGTILSAKPNTGAKKPAYELRIDFGASIGIKTSSAQLVDNYAADELVGRQVAAVVNFPPRRVAKVLSEVLVLGFPDGDEKVVLVSVERRVPNGGRLY